jgi:hypothetical protein
MSPLACFGWLVIAYFAPFLFSLIRGHNDKLAIFLLNLLLGWTLLGWVIALIWSATSNRRCNLRTR